MSSEHKDNPFSDSNIKASLDKIDPPDSGGSVTVKVDQTGVEAEGAVGSEHVEAGGTFKRNWNGVMDWAGLVRFKW
jgi:hypothetical protein